MGVSSLTAALSGLRVTQQQIDTVSGNISNVGTEGYTRKILPQSTQVVNGRTVGVLSETIIRSVDLNLQRDMWTQVSATSFYEVQSTYLQRIEKFHGAPDQNYSIAAELADLKEGFIALADSPEDTFLRTSTVNQAVDMAAKINDFSLLITQQRNDAQDEMSDVVTAINSHLTEIDELNDQIASNLSVGRTVAVYEDQRDQAVKELAELIDISFFRRGDGVMVVQTNQGVEMVGSTVSHFNFEPTAMSPGSYYPDGGGVGVYVRDPDDDPAAVDIAGSSPGGKLGGLLELRDDLFPKQMAQLDELAHKIARRFEAQGLELFTGNSGSVPDDTAPDLGPPIDPVEYVAFSQEIQVNANILNDHSLLQSGTVSTDVPVASGSGEVLRRIVEFTFGATEYQQAAGTVDLSNGGANPRLQDYLGVFSDNTITGTRALDLNDELFTSPSPITNTTDTLTITVNPGTEGGVGSTPLVIDISADIGANPDVQDFINFINGGALAAAGLTAGLNSNNQLELTSRWDVSITLGTLTADGLSFLGLTAGTHNATDPYFDVQVGQDDPVRITVDPDMTIVTLEEALDYGGATQGVPGLSVDTTGGNLTLRPGNDTTPQLFGGDLTLTSGPFDADGTGTATSGISLIGALFGSFTGANESSPIENVAYSSLDQVGGTLNPAFREDHLGPGANISTGIIGVSTLIDYAQKMVNQHAQEVTLMDARAEDEQILRDVLEGQFLDESGINLDEEMGNLIVQQTAYSAAARVITAVSDMFDDLLNAIR